MRGLTQKRVFHSPRVRRFLRAFLPPYGRRAQDARSTMHDLPLIGFFTGNLERLLAARLVWSGSRPLRMGLYLNNRYHRAIKIKVEEMRWEQ